MSAAAPGSSSAAVAAAAAAGAGVSTDIPNEKVLQHAAKLAMDRDKPILLDYYKDSRSGAAFLGQDKDTGEKMLVKNSEEYTSPVIKMFKARDDYIIETENSIYIVSGNIKKKEISSASM